MIAICFVDGWASGYSCWGWLRLFFGRSGKKGADYKIDGLCSSRLAVTISLGDEIAFSRFAEAEGTEGSRGEGDSRRAGPRVQRTATCTQLVILCVFNGSVIGHSLARVIRNNINIATCRRQLATPRNDWAGQCAC